MTKDKKGTLNILTGFRTNNGEEGSFNPWNPYALESIGVSAGALDPKNWSYHVRGDLYEVPEIARKNHECGGSINVYGVDTTSGNPIGLSHVFYIDETGHGGSRIIGIMKSTPRKVTGNGFYLKKRRLSVTSFRFLNG